MSFSLSSLIGLLVASAYLLNTCAGSNYCVPIKLVGKGQRATRLTYPQPAVYMEVTTVYGGNEIGLQPGTSGKTYFTGDVYSLANDNEERHFVSLFMTERSGTYGGYGERIGQLVGSRVSRNIEIEYHNFRTPTNSCDEMVFECGPINNAARCRSLYLHSFLFDAPFNFLALTGDGPLIWCVTEGRKRLKLIPVIFCSEERIQTFEGIRWIRS